jgi:selenide,water dikinase
LPQLFDQYKLLSKPLGTGLIMSGYKGGSAGTQQLERAIGWMRTLNDAAADVLRGLQPSAVTDVTGFGLFGHAHEVAERSGVRIRLESERFPAIDGALDVARKGVRTSGDPRNRDFAERHIPVATTCPMRSSHSARPANRGGLLVPVAESAHRAGGGVRVTSCSSAASVPRRGPES